MDTTPAARSRQHPSGRPDASQTRPDARATPGSDNAGLGGIGIAAGAGLLAAAAVTAYLNRPTRDASVASARREALLTYLVDHLRGADAAIHVVHRLSRTHAGTRDGRLFRELAEEFEEDREVVRSVVALVGPARHGRRRALGKAAGVLMDLGAGGRPGDLSLLLTLEALAIGIQGKRCLFRALQELGEPISLGNHSFQAMEARAIRQWTAVDDRRRALAAMTFPALGERTEARTADRDRPGPGR